MAGIIAGWPGVRIAADADKVSEGVSMESKLERVKKAIKAIRPGYVPGGKATPHKLLLVLAVLDMADEDARLSGNTIGKDEELQRLFRKQLRVHDREGIYLKAEDPLDAPFKRLEPSLWCLEKDGSRKLSASLAPDFYELVQREESRRELRGYVEELLRSMGW